MLRSRLTTASLFALAHYLGHQHSLPQSRSDIPNTVVTLEPLKRSRNQQRSGIKIRPIIAVNGHYYNLLQEFVIPPVDNEVGIKLDERTNLKNFEAFGIFSTNFTYF